MPKEENKIVKGENFLLKRFDELYAKKEEDYRRVSEYLKQLLAAKSQIEGLVHQLSKKKVFFEKAIAELEIDYSMKNKEIAKLEKIEQNIPRKIKSLNEEKKQDAKKIAGIGTEDKKAAIDLARSSEVLITLESIKRKNDELAAKLSEELAAVKRKRELMSQIDWTSDEIFFEKGEARKFIKTENTKRNKEEEKINEGLSKLDKVIDKKLQKDLLELVAK